MSLKHPVVFNFKVRYSFFILPRCPYYLTSHTHCRVHIVIAYIVKKFYGNEIVSVCITQKILSRFY